MANPTFTKASLPFLASARDQRDPDWLDQNRAEFDRLLRKPLVHVAETAARVLAKIAPRYHVPTKGIGRIKIPAYKVGKGDPYFKDALSLRATIPSGERFEYNPHLTFNLWPNEPEWNGVYVIGGLFKPKSHQIKRVRQMIADEPRAYHDLFEDSAFKARFPSNFSTRATNVRVPRDFDPEHPDIAWIMLKDFTVVRKLTSAEFTSPGLAEEVSADFRQLVRLNELLMVALAD